MKVLRYFVIFYFCCAVSAHAGPYFSGGGGGSGNATTLHNLSLEIPDAADDGKYILYQHGTTSWILDTPAGGGDMTAAVWDGDSDGFIDADAGGTDIDTSASTGVPSISTGTWSVAATLTHELGGNEADVSAYSGLVGINAGSTSEVDTEAELETHLGGINIIDSTDIDTFSELDTLVADKSLMQDEDIDTFAELNTRVADKTLINEEDAATIDQDWTFTTGFILGATGDITQTAATVDWDIKTAEAAGLTFDDGGTPMLTFDTSTDNVLVGTTLTSTGKVTANASIDVKNGATSAGVVQIFEDSDDGTNKAIISVPAMAGDVTINLPSADGTASQYLKTDGSGNWSWGDPSGSGDITAVGDGTSGLVFTGGAGDGSTANTLYFEGATVNDLEVILTADNATGSDKTVTLPNETGTVVLGPPGFGTNNRLIKTNGTGNLSQITGITVDVSNNISGAGTISSGSVTSSGSFIIGSADVNETELEIIDGATLGTADLNIIDGIADSGSLTATELLYVDGVTSAIQTQLDARALESVIGDAIEADDLELSGTTLQLVAEIPHSDAAINISGTWEVQNDVDLKFGNDANFGIRWTADMSNYIGTGTDDGFQTELTGAGLVIHGDSAAHLNVAFANTDAGNLYGVTVHARKFVYSDSLEFDGPTTNDSYVEMGNNSSTPSMGAYGLYWESGELYAQDDSTGKKLVNSTDDVDLTGVTNLKIPSAADADSEIGLNTTTEVLSLGVMDSTDTHYIKFDFDVEALDDGDVMAWNASNNMFQVTAQTAADSDTSWDDLQDPDAGAAASWTMNGAGETTTFTMSADDTEWLMTFSGAFTTANSPDLFKIIQSGSSEATTLLTLQAADADVTVFEVGNGTHMWKVDTDGILYNEGANSKINIAGADDLQIGGAQIDYDDMAGAVNAISFGDNASGDPAITFNSGNDGTITWEEDGQDFEFSSSEIQIGDPGGIFLTDDNYIELDATADGMDDDEHNGIVIGGRNCGENLSQWDLVEIVNDADPWHKADATAASGEYPAFGISVAACTDTNEARILVRGVVRNEGWTGLTPGAPIYLGETDGALTETAPSTSNDCVQIVGWALSDSEIYFDFSRPYQLVE